MKFKNYLVEAVMSVEQALKIFGLNSADIGKDANILKQKYKQLSLINHPDRGGSNDKMAELNNAYELLGKAKFSSTGHSGVKGFDREESYRRYREVGAAVKLQILAKFKPEAFIKHFESLDPAGRKYHFTLKDSFPKEKDRSPYSAGFSGEFSTQDRDTIFEFNVSANLTNVIHGNDGKLGYGDISYTLYVTAYGVHGSKRQKLAQQDYKSTKDHASLYKPEMSYPKAKLDKIFSGSTNDRKFSKRDMLAVLKSKLHADVIDSKEANIPLKDDYKLSIYRITFMGTAMWGMHGLYKKYKKINGGPVMSLPETEEIVKWLEHLTKLMKAAKDEDEMSDILTKECEHKNKEIRSSRG